MHRFRRFVSYGGTSLSQLRCYLCSICFLVLFAVFSSLFITSSLPMTNRQRTHFRTTFFSPENKTLTIRYEIAPPSQSDLNPVTDTVPVATAAGGGGGSNSTLQNSTTAASGSASESSVTKAQNPAATSFNSTSSPPRLFATDLVSSDAFKRVRHLCGHGNSRTVHDPYPYLINEEALCAGSVFLVIAVHSKASYRMRRDLIRQTWGSVRQYDNLRVKVVFFVGRSDSQSVQEAVLSESRGNRDVIQREFVEHYRNMSIKHVSVLRWVADHCSHATYFVKVDDDTFVNIFHTIQLLKMRSPRHFMCKVVTGYPVRSARSNMRKWLVTRREYPAKKYPLYCEGFAYLIDVAHVRELYWCSQFTKFFWIDDIFVTGIVAKKLRVTRERLWHGHSWAESIPSLASEKIMDYVFIRAGHNEILPHLWLRIWRATLKYSY